VVDHVRRNMGLLVYSCLRQSTPGGHAFSRCGAGVRSAQLICLSRSKHCAPLWLICTNKVPPMFFTVRLAIRLRTCSANLAAVDVEMS